MTQAADQDEDKFREQIGKQVNSAAWGQHDAGWLAWAHVWSELLELPDIEGLIKIGKASGWWWAFNGAAILTDRPCDLHQDDEGRLHCETGPALKYRDGFSVYAVHGVRVPERIVMEPASLTPEEISEEENAEVRRVMIDQLGVGRYLERAGAQVIDADNHEHNGSRCLLRTATGEQFLFVICPSTGREYHMGVPGDVSTCVEADNFLQGGRRIKLIGAG